MRHPLRKILVPLDPSDYAHAATIQACRIAQAHHAHVTGLTVMDSPEIRASVAPYQYSYQPVVQEAVALHRKHAKEEIAKMENRFSQYCHEQGVDSGETMQEGVPADLILEAATLFDLMTIGLRTFFHFETRSRDGELLSKILDRTSTPILAVKSDPTPLKRALIAYDGSEASARAMRDFVLFAEPLDLDIDLFLADQDEDRRRAHTERARFYLIDHGIDVREVFCTGATPLEAIEAGVTEPYDLVVCGVNSRKWIQNLFVGSFTKKLIERQENCLFLSH